MTRLVVLVLALVGASGPARADFWGSLALHGALQGADYASTRVAFGRGRVEGNGLMRTDMEVKTVGGALVLAEIDSQMGKHSKTAQKVFRGGAIGWVALTVVRNLTGGKR